MAQNDLDTMPQSNYITLVTFTYWTQTLRYAASKKNFTDATANVYTAVPTISIDLRKQTGGIKDEPIAITLSNKVQPIADMLRGYPHATVTVLIEELNPFQEDTRRTLFKGIITKAKSNVSGKSDMAQFEVAGWRDFLSRPLGIPANNTCAWVLGDKNCKKDISSMIITGTITSILGNAIGVSGIGAAPAGRYSRGYLEFQGLRMLVLNHDTTSSMKLIEEPPPEWMGAAVSCIPGCDKSKAICISTFANIVNFGGMGYGIPRIHPIYEQI